MDWCDVIDQDIDVACARIMETGFLERYIEERNPPKKCARFIVELFEWLYSQKPILQDTGYNLTVAISCAAVSKYCEVHPAAVSMALGRLCDRGVLKKLTTGSPYSKKASLYELQLDNIVFEDGKIIPKYTPTIMLQRG